MKTTIAKWPIKWWVAFAGLCACVDRLDLNLPSAQSLMVVEGMINDGPGPYTVKVSNGLTILADTSFSNPVRKAKITLYDDEGSSDDFSETTPGVYVSGNVIQGKIGHAYYIVMETQEGKIFKSAPDVIHPVGEIEQINYSYEARTVQVNNVETAADVFNVSVNANGGLESSNYVRWRFTGTYKVVTHPELHVIVFTTPPPNTIPDPYPCSGWIAEPGPLTQVGPCTCCICWVNQFESVPTVSDGQLIRNNQYRNVKVGEIPINGVTFTEKYLVEVDQMSLTKTAFDFFSLIRAQKVNASNLFQPLPAQIQGNMTAVNSTESVVGIFWATSIKSKSIFIQKSDVPYNVLPAEIPEPCTSYANSSLTPPPFWQ